MLITSIFSFFPRSFFFFYLPKTNFKFSVTSISSSANALNLDQSKNLFFCIKTRFSPVNSTNHFTYVHHRSHCLYINLYVRILSDFAAHTTNIPSAALYEMADIWISSSSRISLSFRPSVLITWMLLESRPQTYIAPSLSTHMFPGPSRSFERYLE